MLDITILLSCFKADALIKDYVDFFIKNNLQKQVNLLVVDFPFSHTNANFVAEQLKRINTCEVIKSNRHLSLYQAWNIGIKNVKTRYVSNLNLDDRVDPQYYQTAIKELELHKAAVFSSFAYATDKIGAITPDSFLQAHISESSFNTNLIAEYGLDDMVCMKNNRLIKNCVPHCAPVWRRDLHEKLGFFNCYAFDFCADYEFWLRVCSIGEKMIVHREPMTIFFCGNNTASDRLMHKRSSEILDFWKPFWPPTHYKPTHLGENHDFLHYCLNINAILSKKSYYNHLKNSKEIKELNSKKLPANMSSSVQTKDSKTPIVSVIIPFYNSAKFLWRSLSSIISQNFQEIEILLVNDQSTDDSLDEIRAFKEAHPDFDIRVIDNQGTKGVSGARNTGIKKAVGKYIAFLDADDRWEHGSLLARLECLQSNSQFSMTHGPVRFVNENEEDLGILLAKNGVISFDECVSNPLHLNSMVIDSRLAKQFSFDETLANGEDWLFISSLLRSGRRSIYCEFGAAVYTIHSSSTVVQDPGKHLASLIKVIDWLCSEQHGELIDKQFISGFDSETKTKILHARLLSRLINAFIFCDLTSLFDLLSCNESISILKSYSTKSIKTACEVPLVRRYLTPVKKLCPPIYLKHKPLYSFLIEYFGFKKALPNFTQAVEDFFQLNTQKASACAHIDLNNSQHKDHIDDQICFSDQKPVLVIGNGPSASLLDFKKIEDYSIDTVGMNAAYRFWDRINFRPKYYICMDDVVILSHQDEIYRLIQENRISGFFLRDEIKKKYPDLSNHPRIFWFSQAQKLSWLFQTNSITTGSWAIRWMAYIGFNRIGLIGIDSNYVEILPEAEKNPNAADLKLRIKTTPAWNPNYFFSDYQKEGDLYNVPNNPDVERNTGLNVHFLALKRADKDVKIFRERISITDCSPLSEHDIFPKKNLSRFLCRDQLSIVTSFKVPVDRQDALLLAFNLIANCNNRFVKSVHILLEGSWEDFLNLLPHDIASNLRFLNDSSSLVLHSIHQRPNYFELFEYSKFHCDGVVAISNADIYLTESSSLKVLRHYKDTVFSENSILALTRWNLTRDGLFLQGMNSNPPWQEISPQDDNAWLFNAFSYDTYIYSNLKSIPDSLKGVYLGTYGCDTAIASIFKLAGYSVRNPSVDIQCCHLDDKPRTYSSESSRKDLLSNVSSVRHQIAQCLKSNSSLQEILDSYELFSRNSVWIAGCTTIDFFHSIFRTLGSTPCENINLKSRFRYFKIYITNSSVSVSPSELASLIRYPFSGPVFLEWQVSGQDSSLDISKILGRFESYSHLVKDVANYQWQSFICQDKCSAKETKLSHLTNLFLRNILLSSSGNLLLKDDALVLSGFPKLNNLPASIHFTEGYKPLANSEWEVLFLSPKDQEHIIYVFELPVYHGTKVDAVFNLTSSANLQLRLTLGRHGRTDYEGTSQEICIASNTPSRQLISHNFGKNHESVKLQINVLSVDMEHASLKIDCELFSINGIKPKSFTHSNKKVSDKLLLGPFSKENKAHYDETDAVAAYLVSKTDGVMLDVGAHHGFALKKFLEREWRVWAFEPDHKNRAKLLERLAAHKNRDLVTLDTRCVSHTSQKNLPFFQSGESTGISGLSAFRDTHVEAQRVDTVSLADYFADKEMPAVDFLKIDTEGHDLFVLQGFPWERNRPRVIECEFEDLKSKPLGYTTKDMADFLVGKGYTVYVSEWHPILKYGQRHDWHRLQKYPCELACYEAWGNLLAFSEPPDEAKLVAAIKSVLKSAPKSASPLGTTAQNAASPNLEATPCFTPTGPNSWVFTKAKAGKQNLLIFKHPAISPTANRAMLASFRVVCDAPVQIAISLGRYDHKRSYEGTTIKQKLTPGQPWSGAIKHRFRENHSDLKLQFEILDCPTATCTLEIQEHRVQEANPPQPAAPIVLAPNSFAQANTLFRIGQYAEALQIYEALAAREPLAIYRDNARMAQRKLEQKNH